MPLQHMYQINSYKYGEVIKENIAYYHKHFALLRVVFTSSVYAVRRKKFLFSLQQTQTT
jgi:hypothetical protein